jgi:hypothetical protein
VVQTARNGTLTLSRVPGDQPPPASLAALRAARANGTLTRLGAEPDSLGLVAPNETLVVTLSAPGLAAAVRNETGDAADLRGYLNATDAAVAAPFRSGTAEGAIALTAPATRTVADPANDTYHLAVPLDRTPLVGLGEDGGPPRVVVGDRYRVTATLGGGVPAGDPPARPVRIVDGRVIVPPPEGAERVLVPGGSNATVFGLTRLAPGTRIRLLARTTDGETVAGTVARVRGDRSGSELLARLDLSGVAPGTRLRLAASGPGVPGENTTVVVREANASVSVPDQSGDGRTLRVDAVTVSHGGFVVARNESGTLVGVDYLPPGTHRDVDVDLSRHLGADGRLSVTVRHDRDRDGGLDDDDPPYRADGAPVRDAARYDLDASRTEEDGGDDGGGDETTATATGSGDPGPTGSGSGPGPGALAAVALVLLGILAFVLARRGS